MGNLLLNWRTSLTGVSSILLGIGALAGLKIPGIPIGPEGAMPLIVGGFGLLFAKDSKVTGKAP